MAEDIKSTAKWDVMGKKDIFLLLYLFSSGIAIPFHGKL